MTYRNFPTIEFVCMTDEHFKSALCLIFELKRNFMRFNFLRIKEMSEMIFCFYITCIFYIANLMSFGTTYKIYTTLNLIHPIK